MDAYQYNRACGCIRCRSRGIMGPVIMVTIGLLFLLDNFGAHGFDFGRTWPIILLVIGGVKLLQNGGPTDGHIQPVLPLSPVVPVPPPPPAPPSGEVGNV